MAFTSTGNEFTFERAAGSRIMMRRATGHKSRQGIEGAKFYQSFLAIAAKQITDVQISRQVQIARTHPLSFSPFAVRERKSNLVHSAQ
jgi:hypothetical protein